MVRTRHYEKNHAAVVVRKEEEEGSEDPKV